MNNSRARDGQEEHSTDQVDSSGSSEGSPISRIAHLTEFRPNLGFISESPSQRVYNLLLVIINCCCWQINSRVGGIQLPGGTSEAFAGRRAEMDLAPLPGKVHGVKRKYYLNPNECPAKFI